MATTIEHGFAEPRVPQIPERRLWAVCLMDGIREALTLRYKRLQAESKRVLPVESLALAERWLMDPTWRHVGSFIWICEQLGYEPDHMRSSAIMNAREILKRDSILAGAGRSRESTHSSRDRTSGSNGAATRRTR